MQYRVNLNRRATRGWISKHNFVYKRKVNKVLQVAVTPGAALQTTQLHATNATTIATSVYALHSRIITSTEHSCL